MSWLQAVRLLYMQHWTFSKASSEAGKLLQEVSLTTSTDCRYEWMLGGGGAAPEPAWHCSVEVLGELKEETRWVGLPMWEPQSRLRMEREKGLGGKKVGGESCRTCQPGWAELYKQREPLQLCWCVTGDKAIFQGKAAVAMALEDRGLPPRDD